MGPRGFLMCSLLALVVVLQTTEAYQTLSQINQATFIRNNMAGRSMARETEDPQEKKPCCEESDNYQCTGVIKGNIEGKEFTNFDKDGYNFCVFTGEVVKDCSCDECIIPNACGLEKSTCKIDMGRPQLDASCYKVNPTEDNLEPIPTIVKLKETPSFDVGIGCSCRA